MNLIAPKVGAKHGLLFNEPTSEIGLSNKSSCLTQALGVAKFKQSLLCFWSHFVGLLKSDLNVELSLSRH
jgi:hypothetical protein